MACSFRECSQRESNPQLALRRRLLYPFNYENECRIFGLFNHFGIGNHIFVSNSYILLINKLIVNLSERLKFYETLHPDLSFKSAPDLWLTGQIFLVNADIKKNIL